METVELTSNSIQNLCNGVFVQQPIVQLLGYEAVELVRNETNYRLVLSDGVHMNSYFYLCNRLNDLIEKNEIKFGTMLRIDKYKFMDGENCTDHSPRWITFVQEVMVLIHRNVFGNPQPLANVEKKKNPLINLNLKNDQSRVFYSIEQLENNLIKVQDLNNQSKSACSFTLKLTVSKKYPINTYSRCRILNMNMEDSTGMENETYYITDTILKHNGSCYELKLQVYSVIIECVNQMVNNMKTTDVFHFNKLLEKPLNTFCNLFGLCVNVGDVEVCCYSNTQTEIAKREIELIDASMTTITLKVWGENVNKFDEKFDDLPIVAVKQAVLKEFNGYKHFSLLKSSVLTINPVTVEAHELREWYKKEMIGNF